MGRFMIFLGIALIFVAVGAMLAVFAVEDIPFIQDMLVEQFCEPGETTITSAQRLSFGGTQNSTTVFFCEDNEGSQREITGDMTIVLAGAFLIPFVLGMFMIFAGAWRASQNVTKALDNVIYSVKGNSVNLQDANIPPEQREILQTVMGSLGGASASPSLADRLKQLDEARQQGLITSAEYERTRQAILDAMDDNI